MTHWQPLPLETFQTAVGFLNPALIENNEEGGIEIVKTIVHLRSFMSLRIGTWLNDEIINGIFALIPQNFPHISCMNSHFIGLWVEVFEGFRMTVAEGKSVLTLPPDDPQGVDKMLRWTNKGQLDLKRHKLMFIPINETTQGIKNIQHGVNGVHWTFAVVDFERLTITYYDSYNKDGNRPDINVFNIVVKILSHVLPGHGKSNAASYQRVNARVVQQDNGWDCGVWACTNACKVAQNYDLNTMRNDHMPEARMRIAASLIEQKLWL